MRRLNSLSLQTAQCKYYLNLWTLGPKVGAIRMLGVLGIDSTLPGHVPDALWQRTGGDIGLEGPETVLGCWVAAFSV